MVPSPKNLPGPMQQVASPTDRSLCYQIQQQTTSVCLSSTRPHGNSSGCTQPFMGESGCLRFPTDSHSGQSSRETTGHSFTKDNLDCPGVAQHALVLGSGHDVQPNSTGIALPTQPADTTLQSDPSQKSDQPQSPCLAPRASTIKEQGFSQEVATNIEAPQRRSTRSVYEAKWTIFTKWCLSNKVDFRAPPINSIADFLLHLFQERNLQPSTIDGYRSAIEKLGNTPLNFSKDENLTRLLDSFHRDRPKGRRGIPSRNLSLVLHQLTKPTFEPIKEASLKHLTFKTVFLLALGSGKRRIEIRAWQNKNIRHQSDWSKEGPSSVAPVVIPVLAPTLAPSLTGSSVQSEPCATTWTGPQAK